jgi:outer membrane protein assembly factor BamA
VERLNAAALALAALLFGAGPERPAPVVSGVVLRLPPGEDAAVLEGLVAARAGEPLSARALRRTVTLLYQLGRFSDVVIRAEPAGEGQVLLVVECLPRRVVARLQVENRAARPVLDAEALRKLAAMPEGDEFWQGRLDAALERIRAAYLRRGRRAAAVAGQASGETQVEVRLEVDEGPPTLVTAVSLGAARGEARALLERSLRIRPGAVLDLDLLEEDVRRLRTDLRRGGWLRSRVEEPRVAVGPGGAAVEIPVEPGPRVAFRVVGAGAVPERVLLLQLGIEPEQPLDDAALDAAAARLRGFYQERGHAAARVEVRTVPGRDQATVLFDVDEGRHYRVSAVRFPGVRQRDEAWLVKRLRESFDPPAAEAESAGDTERLAAAAGSTSPPRAAATAEPGQAWHEPSWRQAVARVVDLYRADGHLDAAHEGTRVVLDARAGTAEVEIRLREGSRTVVDSVAFEGNAAVPLARILEEARLRPGDPLSFAAVEQTRASIVSLYGRLGYLYARVQDAADLSPDRTRAAVRFHIEEGPRVKVGSVVVAGNKRTREDVVRGTLELEAGDVYDPAAVARSQTALLRLGVFRSVGLRLNDPEVPESEKDLTVELSERPWRTLAPGVGYSLAGGPRAFVEFSQPNLLGRALELAARAKVNDPGYAYYNRDIGKLSIISRLEGYGNVGLHYPRLHFLSLPAGVHLDAIAERVHRQAYDLTRFSNVLGIDGSLHPRATLSLQAEVEVDDVTKRGVLQDFTLTRADVERLRFPAGITTLLSLRPSLTLDWRDNSVHPRTGWLAAVSADFSRSLGDGRKHVLYGLIPGSEVFTNMVRLQGTGSTYLTLGKAVLAVSVRGGFVVALDRQSKTIGPKRFYLGGASSMRGAGEDEVIPEDLRGEYLKQLALCNNSLSGVLCNDAARAIAAGRPPSEGGQAFVLGKVELRFPLRESLEAAVFTDVGNLWLAPGNVSLAELRPHLGLGLRFLTPIGPAVLDVGFNPSPDRRLSERLVAPHFSIGMF